MPRGPSGGHELRREMFSRKDVRRIARHLANGEHVLVEGMDEPCWPWPKSRTKQGYGLVGVVFAPRTPPTVLLVHRVVFAISRGILPAGVVVRHRCDNPPCARPRHLLDGTQQDNMRDYFERRLR